MFHNTLPTLPISAIDADCFLHGVVIRRKRLVYQNEVTLQGTQSKTPSKGRLSMVKLTRQGTGSLIRSQANACRILQQNPFKQPFMFLLYEIPARVRGDNLSNPFFFLLGLEP